MLDSLRRMKRSKKKRRKKNTSESTATTGSTRPLCISHSVYGVRCWLSGRMCVCMYNCVNERDRMHQHQRKCKICVNKAACLFFLFHFKLKSVRFSASSFHSFYFISFSSCSLLPLLDSLLFFALLHFLIRIWFVSISHRPGHRSSDKVCVLKECDDENPAAKCIMAKWMRCMIKNRGSKNISCVNSLCGFTVKSIGIGSLSLPSFLASFRISFYISTGCVCVCLCGSNNAIIVQSHYHRSEVNVCEIQQIRFATPNAAQHPISSLRFVGRRMLVN